MTLYGQDGEGDGDVGPKDSGLPIGAVLANRYRVVRRLGAGGMGVVYEVIDEHLEEEVALKLLHPELSTDDDHRQRLRSEVRLARRVSHPNVCRVHDLGEHEDQLFVTMELIRGDSLRETLARLRRRIGEPLPLPRKVDIVVQVCSALSAAHRAGVLHRDVKPDNIILGHERVVLTDFGVAGLTAELAKTRRVVAGTPAYIAPEVLRGQAYDHRIDVYACAIVAYELIAERQPFVTASLDDAIRRARENPTAPSLPEESAESSVRAGLQAALLRALAANPEHRTRSVDVLAEEIAEAARGHSRAAVWVGGETGQATLETLAGDSRVEQPTVTAVAALGPGKRSSTTSRSQLRVATVLAFECTASPPAAAVPTSAHGQLDTQAVPLAAAGDALERIVVDLGGTPLRVTATSILALFGAPVALGDDAIRAARAAHALLEITANGRAGIDTARLIYRRGPAGPVATGDAIVHAEGLVREAAPGEVRASPPAARQLAGQFRLTEAPEQSGEHERGNRALLVFSGTRDRFERATVQPMLGRREELAALEALVQRVCEQRAPAWGAVLGPAGFGKTRLRQELQRVIDERREIDWLVGRAAPLGEVTPLSLLRSADPSWIETAGGDQVIDQRGAFAAARQWLEHRAARRPVMLLFEDVQWADEASLAFLRALRLELDPGVPVGVLLFGRNEARARDIVPANGVVVELAPLDDRTARELARALAPAANEEDLRQLAGRAGGNPFFIEELARDLGERVQQAPPSSTTITTIVTPLPATVEAVVQGRLDRLPPRAREVVCAAAVIGREFWREAVLAVMRDGGAIDDAELDAILAELEHRGIVAPMPPTSVDDERYVFHSALVGDVAYQQLAPRERRRAHAAVARWLEPRVRDRDDPAVLVAIASHRDLAQDPGAAHIAYVRAGRRALELFAHKEAAHALRRAAELRSAAATDPSGAEKDHLPHAELLELLGDAQVLADSIEAGERAYLEALELVAEEPLALGRLLYKLAHAATERADNQAAIEYARRGLQILAPGDQPTPIARANPTCVAALYGTLGWTLGYVMTDNEVGLPYSERAAALLAGTPHKRELAHALSRLGANYMRAGRWGDQLSCNLRNLRIAEELGDLSMQLTANINLGVTYASLGELDQAIEHTRRAVDLAIRTSAVTTSALVRSNLGGLLLDRGQLVEAGEQLTRAIEIGERVGARRFLPEGYGFLARTRLQQGDLEGAVVAARRSLALASYAAATIDEGIASRVLGGVLGRRGEYAEAEGLLARAQDQLADADVFEGARTTAQRARFFALRDQPGDRERAAELRAEAAPIFQRLGASLDLARLDDDLEVR